MGGGLMQLVAYGAQDIYLTGNPQITFFKVVYRRHTNFSVEAVEQNMTGTANFGGKASCTISRNGDLIYRTYLVVDLPEINPSDTTLGLKEWASFRWLNWIGHALISKIDFKVGGTLQDSHTGHWLHIWNTLTQKSGLQVGYADMVGNVPRLTQFVQNIPGALTGKIPSYRLYIPLQFWFCRNPGLALPLIALQYHSVTLDVTFESRKLCYFRTDNSYDNFGPDLLGASIYVDYIYLDTDERRRFAQVAHEYLVETVQFTGAEIMQIGRAQKINLNFNHPVKEIIWVIQPDENWLGTAVDSFGGPQRFNYTDSIDPTFYTGVPGNPMGEGMVTSDNMDFGIPFGVGYDETGNGHPGVGMLQDVNGLPSVQNPGGVYNWDGLSVNQGHVVQYPGFEQSLSGLSGHSGSGGVTPTGATYPQGAIPGQGPSMQSGGSGVSQNQQALNNFLDDESGLPMFDRGCNPVCQASIYLNGHQRFQTRYGRYFNLVQPYQHHENIPPCGINVYSFALKPEEHQPSGTCNFSRIDSAHLHLFYDSVDALSSGYCGDDKKIKNAKIRIFALNYNVFRIMSGMGAMAYTN